jgi:hypothetical protein
MKILVAGGTGAIGRPLIAQLLAKGHTVVALTRSAEKAQTVAERIAVAMSVGAGLLLAGVSLKVTTDAIRLAGPMAAALAMLVGAATFSGSNALLARFGAVHRKRRGDCVPQPAESQQPGSGVAISTLQRANGRIFGPKGAAELLGVKPTTLQSRLRALGIRTPDNEARR